MENQPLVYDVDGAAKASNSSRSRIYIALGRGELESYKDGKRRRITRKALENWLAKLEREGGRKVA